jgi:integrase
MPKQATPLTDTKIRNTSPGTKDITLFDGGGLFLLIKATGSKLWRLKYRHLGKDNMLSMGAYPEVTLKEARSRRDAARQLLANGTNPSDARKELAKEEQATTTTFRQVFDELLLIQASKLAETTVNKIRSSMEIHALPKIGELPIAEIKVDDLLVMLRNIETKGALEMARRVRAWSSRVFRYAIIIGKCERDPAADLRGALRVPVVKHHAALQATDLPAFLKALHDPMIRIYPLTRLALHLLVMTATRPGELRAAQWPEFDLDKAEWRIPALRMKMKEEHVVPLSSKAISLIKQIKLFSGDGIYLFPAQGNSNRTLSENTLGKAAKSLGFAVTAHGFRSTFSTYANESEEWSSDAIEAQLAHKPTDAVRSAYYRGSRRMEERRRLMQWWSDELDEALRLGQYAVK